MAPSIKERGGGNVVVKYRSAMTFDSPVYSRKTRIDLDIRVINCTNVYIFVHIHTISRVIIRILEMHVYIHYTHTFLHIICIYNIILH